MTSPSLAIESVDRNFVAVPIHDQANKQTNPSISTWYGRTVNEVKNCAHTIFSKIVFLAQKVIGALGSIAVDSNTVAGIFRRLNGQVFDALQHLKVIPPNIDKLKNAAGSFVGCVDTLQVVGGVDYFCSKKYNADSDVKVASRISIFVADVAGALLWFQEMSFINLSKAAAALGNIRLFSFVPKVVASVPLVRDVSSLQRVSAFVGEVRVFGAINQLSMCVIARRAQTLFYAFSAVDTIHTISKAGSSSERKIQAGLDLSYWISELALDALLTAGMTNVVGLGVVGAVCITTNVARFAYKTYK